MATKISKGRRNFLKGAAASAAAAVVTGERTVAQAQNSTQQPPASRSATAPVLAKENDPAPVSSAEVLTADRPGSDFMLDVLKTIGFEYLIANPGSSFRGLHESILNYGGNTSPEFITCCHEESAVAMAHGYAKAEGKPALVMAHGTVGLQHASMAIYNAFCDRVPLYIIVGNTTDAATRRPGVEWDHSVQDAASLVRDFTKWDDLPISLPHFAESAMRAYKIAMTPPMMPVLLVADGDLQETPVSAEVKLRVPKVVIAAPPQGDSGAVSEAAKLLVAAENPVLIADRLARTQHGMSLLIELAETLQAPVIDQRGRMNFPSRHPLNQTERARTVIAAADMIAGLELTDFWGATNSFRDQLHRTYKPITKPSAKLISINSNDLFMRSNYQDVQRFTEADIAIAADAEATLPALIEACKKLITADRKRAFEERGKKLAAAHQEALDSMHADATYAWDASPITTARLSAELWMAVKDHDWTLVGNNAWAMRLWNFDKPYRHIGGSGGAGVGYGAPAALGAALSNKKRGRLSVNIQNDGDLMYAPGVLWTSAHHQIPLLSVMHNNRAYHQEMMHLQRMANRHQRGITTAGVGTTLLEPNIDYATVAKGMGIQGIGPINDPKDLAPAFQRGVEIAMKGEPVLIDVITQPR
jgi:acetolactate synthase I/II/III large subunit